MRQGWCIGLRLPVQLRANNHLVSIISLLSPEELVFYCDFIPHVLPLYEEMATLIPKKYIPPITKVDNMQEYILLGTMILSTTQNYESSI